MGLLQTTVKPKTATFKTLTPLTNAGQSQQEEYPVPGYQFSVMVDGKIVAFFQNVTGMAAKREVEPLTEGGLNNYTYEFPGHVSYEHITLEVGLTSSKFFWEWMMDGQFDGYAQAKSITLIQRRPNPSISDKDKEIFKEVHRWVFVNAFPVSWKLSDLTLDDSEKIVIETLELSFDYFERVDPA